MRKQKHAGSIDFYFGQVEHVQPDTQKKMKRKTRNTAHRSLMQKKLNILSTCYLQYQKNAPVSNPF